MSRSGYSDDCDGWDLIRWRGAVASAIRGKRGQKLLRELESALVALPKKTLCSNDFANSESGQVCALGSVALKRRLDGGEERIAALKSIEEEFPEGSEAEEASDAFDIADALVKEITFVNDDHFYSSRTPEQRYKYVLEWVREQITQ